MSRADWSFLEQLLEEGQDWLTGAGRVWVTVLFLFRLLVLGAAAESVWDDEQEDFVCNTRQPGCTSVCYDKAFPISHFRYFVMQVIFVSTPTIFYFGYVAARVVKEKKEAEAEEGGGEEGGEKGKREEEEEKKGVGPPKLRGRLLCAYTSSVVLKVLLEAGFMAGLWLLYGGLVIRPRFQCVRWPCPHTVDCFVSRPTEKTVFTVYTQAAAALSLLLNLAELTHLLWRALSRRGAERGAQGRTPEGPDPREGGRLQHLPPAPPGEPSYPRRYADPGSEDNWGPGGAGDDDLLPSYLNCVGGGARGAPHCPRAPGPQKHTPGTHQDKHHAKGPHQGHGKHKHYV